MILASTVKKKETLTVNKSDIREKLFRA